MGILDFLTGEFIDVIHWTDDTRDTMVWRFEREAHEIKYGAKLTVREGQAAVFVHEGQLADVFTPGLYMLETNNMPIMTSLQHWDHGFQSPFKSEIYFVNTNRFTNLKWGTKNPIMLRDPEFGPTRIRAFGTYTIKVADPALFMTEIVGTDGEFTTDEVTFQIRNIIVQEFSRAIAQSGIPVLDMAANTAEVGALIAKAIDPTIAAYGLTLPELYIENISLPAEVEKALDARTSRGLAGNLDDHMKWKAAEAMGKGGAYELNYSSDVDLICLFDETRFDVNNFHDARSAFVRVTRKMAVLLSDLTADGYVFRTDLRLRPDPSVTPVCLSMEAAERYYESVGRTWERAAYIKARASAGDIAAGEGFLKTLTPFVWRKHLDFVAIQDAHDMRLRIREHKGLGGKITLKGHNMKLGRGGIREIEFFTQTRQLIAGGRDPALRCRGTVDGLAALAHAGWVPPADADVLTDHYRHHREVEHRLQMINDAQTHDLPGGDDGMARLAAFIGVEDAAMRTDLRARLEEVHAMTEGFFAPDATAPTSRGASDFGDDITARWLTYPALRSDRAVEIFDRLKPRLLNAMQDAAKPQEALLAFGGFLAGLPAGVQVFSLFEANPPLTQLIIDIAATAPALAHYLGRNSAVFDAVIGGDFFTDWPGCDVLTKDLTGVLDRAPDYEARLDSARRWMKEWHFRIGVHHLRGLIDAGNAGRQYSDLARAVLAAIFPVVEAHMATKHGPPPGRGAVVVAMGSLGAGRIHAASDLDLILIYDGQGEDASIGPRPLQTRAYYARLTKALVTSLTAPMAEGRLYEVDMRLRPSGGKGPVATAFSGFEGYQMGDAWTWEHLALTRALVVAGDAALGDDIESVRSKVLAAKSGNDAVRAGQVSRENARRQTKFGVIGAGQNLFFGVESEHGEDWSKNFFARDCHVVGDVGKDGGL